MCAKAKQKILRIKKGIPSTGNSAEIFAAVNKLLEEFRSLDRRALSQKIGRMISKAKPLIKPVAASLKKIKRVNSVLPSMKPKAHVFANAEELNKLMKESLKRRSWSSMTMEQKKKFIREFDSKLDLPTLKEGKYLAIADPPTKIFRDGEYVYHEVEIADSLGARLGGERQYLESATPFGKEAVEKMERAHSAGPGLGIDSPYGLYFAPKYVNQKLQNEGVEAFIGILHETLKKEGKKVRMTTRTKPHIGTHRLQEIAYKIEIIDKDGHIQELCQYAINIGTDKSLPLDDIILAPSKLAKNLDLKKKMQALETKNSKWKGSALAFLDKFLDAG